MKIITENIKASRGLSFLALMVLMVSLAVLSSCRADNLPGRRSQLTATPAASSAQDQSPSAAEPTAEPTFPAPYSTWIDPDLPQLLRDRIANLDDFPATDDLDSALVIFSAESGEPLGEWVFLAAAPFYSHTKGVKSDDLRSCWESGSSDKYPFAQILTTQAAENFLTHIFGEPNRDCVLTVDELEIADKLWLHPGTIALIPFELIDPAYRIVAVDGQDPLNKSFQLASYPLAVPFYFQAPFDITAELNSQIDLTNFNQEKLSTVALTGVTAMVRDTAVIMEDKGLTYPAEDVKEILTSADITHINNEVPFAEDCPPPTSSQNSLQFCSDDRYLELMEAVGTDIVELSGDHFGDWGPEAMIHTLDLYREEGWLMYGGGENLQAGLDPVFITDHGNRFAFIGCNGKSFDAYATATETNPGASRCDFEWMVPEIQQLTEDGYLVIATMQHEEVDSFYPIALQLQDFRLLADAGAVIVSGSQAHHPQAFEYNGSSFIHYGLGNMFFDQWYLATRVPEIHINKDKSFIDLHYFYDGRYIGTRLMPLQFIDNARPRPMTEEEEVSFLSDVYEYSLWKGKWVYLYPLGYYSEAGSQ